MNKFLKLAVFLLISVLFFCSHFVWAEELSSELPIDLVERATGELPPPMEEEDLPVLIHLNIINATTTLYNDEINVLSCDSDNNPATEDEITAYCAILQTEIPSDWNWNWAPGAFIDSLSDISGFISKDENNNDQYHYWSWSLNGGYAETALNLYKLKRNDLVTLEFIEPLIIEPEVPEIPINSNTGGSYNSGDNNQVEREKLAITKALSYLESTQKSDGSFGNAMYTDWVAIAAKSGNNHALKSTLSTFLRTKKITGDTLTDYERRAMALMALDINPYTGTDINYIEKIIESFDGEQLGDPSLVNDDIFGLIVLAKAGYLQDDLILKKIIDFIIKKQSFDGSWESVDLTSAGVQALENYKKDKTVKKALDSAYQYLTDEQDSDGGYGNAYSTSWAIMALSQKDNNDDIVKKAVLYLLDKQDLDGGYPGTNIESRIWATAYATPAILKLSWNDILAQFDKEEDDIENNKISNQEIKTSEINLFSPSDAFLVEPVQMQVVNQDYIEVIKVVNPQQNAPHLIIHQKNIKEVGELVIKPSPYNNQTASLGDATVSHLSLQTIFSKLGAKIKAFLHFFIFLWDSW